MSPFNSITNATCGGKIDLKDPGGLCYTTLSAQQTQSMAERAVQTGRQMNLDVGREEATQDPDL